MYPTLVLYDYATCKELESKPFLQCLSTWKPFSWLHIKQKQKFWPTVLTEFSYRSTFPNGLPSYVYASAFFLSNALFESGLVHVNNTQWSTITINMYDLRMKDSCMKRQCFWGVSTNVLDNVSHLTAFCARVHAHTQIVWVVHTCHSNLRDTVAALLQIWMRTIHCVCGNVSCHPALTPTAYW